MKIQCDYCGNTYEDTEPRCPACGAANTSHNNGDKKPRTIEELQGWYRARNLPPEEVTRFFIGKNITEPRAFGIYQDDAGEFVVYKNKADGSRAIRYQGGDEQYAVNELYLKLKDEIVRQKSRNAGTRSSGGKKTKGSFIKLGIFAAAIAGIVALFIHLFKNTSDGYYSYRGNTYYRYQSHTFLYDTDRNDWLDTDLYGIDVPPEVNAGDKNSEYYEGSSWNSDMDVTDWEESEYYEEYHDNSYDYDSDYDWDSGSDWDSGGSDWDSDW
ncbi:MAG: hypothetical protein K6B72_08575 [Lachnospiraceae bacterium]|nr:hypothetical protein [Lachnospiraceae bacterium]